MVVCFAEAAGKIAIVGFECVGKCIAFGFEHQTHAFVIVQHLIIERCTAVGRNEKRAQKGLLRLLGIGIIFVGHIFGLFEPVFFHLDFITLSQPVTDRFDQVAAKGKTSLAGRSLSRTEQKKIGKYFATAINAINMNRILFALFVTPHCPSIIHHCKTTEGKKLRQKFAYAAAFEIDGSHYFHQVF